MSIAALEQPIVDDLSNELYQDFLKILNGREITEIVKSELSLEFPEHVINEFITKLQIDNRLVKKKGSTVAKCERIKTHFKYPRMNYFELYQSEKNSQLLSKLNGEKVCLILNATIIKNNQFNDFMKLFISDNIEENTAEKIYYKIEQHINA